MSMTSDQDVIDSVTRTIQIIAAALVAGVVAMLGMSVVVAPMSGARPGAGEADIGEILTWAAVAIAAVFLPLSLVIPRLITNQNRRGIAAGTWVPPTTANRSARGTPSPSGPSVPESEPGKLTSVYMTQFVVGAALNEGPAIFACLAYMLGGRPVALGLAFLLLGALIARFPTRPRIASWIEGQQELLFQDRHTTS